MGKRRKRRKGWQGLVSERDRAIAYLSSARFQDEGDERFRGSLVDQFARRGILTGAQWFSVFDLRERHRAIRRQTNNGGCYVYAISAGGAIKVGLSNDPQKRAQNLQVGNAESVEVIGRLFCETRCEAKKLEKKIHKDGKRFHIRGEWFREDVLTLFGL